MKNGSQNPQKDKEELAEGEHRSRDFSPPSSDTEADARPLSEDGTKSSSNLPADSPETLSTAPEASAASLRLKQLEQDVVSKTYNRGNAKPSQPGAVAEGGASNLSRLEQEIAAKTRGTDRSSSGGSVGLIQLEQDVAAKARGRNTTAATRPGAAPSGAAGLLELERDVIAKSVRNSNTSQPGAVSELDVVNGVGVTSASTALNQLERDVIAKSKSYDARSSASVGLHQFENDILAKNQVRLPKEASASAAQSLVQMENNLAAKLSASGAAVSPSNFTYSGKTDTRSRALMAPNALTAMQQLEHQIAQKSEATGGTTPPPVGVLSSAVRGPSVPSTGSGRPLRAEFTPDFSAYDIPPPFSYESHPVGEHAPPDIHGFHGTQYSQDIPGAESGGIEAFVADNVVEAVGVAVIMSEEEEEAVGRKRRKRYLCFGALFLLLLVVAIVVTVVIITGRSSTTVLDLPPTAAPSSAPSSAPSFAPTTDGVQALISCLTPATSIETFQDRASAQYRAVEWLTNTDPFVQINGLQCDSPKFLQRYALATFYFALSGEEWEICGLQNPECTSDPADFGWLSTQDECNWYKVRCNNLDMVESINFADNTAVERALTILKGAIPKELQYLTDMVQFVVADMQIEDSIQDSFSTWLKLERLILSRNNFTSSIPDDIAITNPLLSDFQVSDNQLSGRLPDGLVSLSLQDLRLDGNRFTGSLPSSFGENSERLNNLAVQRNQLAGPLPSLLWTLPNLRTLDLSENAFSGEVPTTIGLMQNLRVLRLHSTQLGGELPAEFFGIPNFSTLNIANCRFRGALSENFINFNQTLQEVIVAFNNFTGPIPVEAFEAAQFLEELNLQGNQLSGVISEALCNTRGTAFGQLAFLIVDCNIDCNCCDPVSDCG
jgi:Leucine-rich repeat (LRR) protein